MSSRPALIGLDWGTTSLRAYLIDADGNVLARQDSGAGIMAIGDGDFASALAAAVAPWSPQHGQLPLIASGMIGSRQGWHEVPYCRCPAGEQELARALRPVETDLGRLHLVPGLDWRGDDGVPDVMRGEETQIIGALAGAGPAGARLFVLPGTHSKWALADGGRIVRFATFMTGELFATLKAHTILGRTMSGEVHDVDAFGRGLDYGGEGAAKGGLLKRLFSVRTLALLDDLPASAGASYLSGLLIGSELREAVDVMRADAEVAAQVSLIGRTDLAGLYAVALNRAGIAVDHAADDAAAHGHWRIATAAGLLGG